MAVRTVHTIVALTLLVLSACASSRTARDAGASSSPSPTSLFLEAWSLTRDNFYDPAMNGVDWDTVRDELLPAANATTTPADQSRVINRALDRLHASHTRHYAPHRREYYELLDIFHPAHDGVPASLSPHIPPGPVSYVGIGLVTTEIDGRLFVADIYDAGPAHAAGILVGDELLGVEDGAWSDIDAFRGLEGRPTRVRVRRSAGEEPRKIVVTPARIHPRQAFLAAMDASARVMEYDGRRVAYVRVRSYAHTDYHDALVELVRTRFRDADALVLDLRGPWGGANPEYLSLFNPITPAYAARPRGGAWTDLPFTWRKPVALVIDDTVRSGKEIIAHAFREHSIGPLVGTRTGGAVLGGRPFVLSDGSVLYLAVHDVRIDGRRLEGAGVEPTVRVERTLPYCMSEDPPVRAAVHEVSKLAPAR